LCGFDRQNYLLRIFACPQININPIMANNIPIGDEVDAVVDSEQPPPAAA
jgi:hypothetical protein